MFLERLRKSIALVSVPHVVAIYLATLFAVLAVEVVLASVFVVAGGNEPSLFRLFVDRLNLRVSLEILAYLALTGLVPFLIVVGWPNTRTATFATAVWAVLLAGVVAGYTNRAIQIVQMLASGT